MKKEEEAKKKEMLAVILWKQHNSIEKERTNDEEKQ